MCVGVELKPGQVAYITTGSKMPKGADAVSKHTHRYKRDAHDRQGQTNVRGVRMSPADVATGREGG